MARGKDSMLKRIVVTALLGATLVFAVPVAADAGGRDRDRDRGRHGYHKRDRDHRHHGGYNKGYRRGYRHGYRDGYRDDYYYYGPDACGYEYGGYRSHFLVDMSWDQVIADPNAARSCCRFGLVSPSRNPRSRASARS